MTKTATTVVAWATWLLVVVMALIGLAFMRPGNAADPYWIVPISLTAALLATVGSIILSRLPRHRIGWLLLITGLIAGIASAGASLGDLGLNVAPGLVPAAVWIYWASVLADTAMFGLIGGFIPFLFPTGHLPSRRWWPVFALGVAATSTGLIQSAFAPWSPGSVNASNPLEIDGPLAPVITLIGTVSYVCGALALAGAGASLVYRYRSAETIEKQQLKWIAYLAALITPAAVIATITSDMTGTLGLIELISGIVALIGFVLLPIAIGIAVLKYRLYDIDIVIRRTLVYVPLTAMLAGLFAAFTAAVQKLFVVATGNPSDAALIIATLVTATAFTPMKNALQAAVDRRFRDDSAAPRKLTAFAESLLDAPFQLDRNKAVAAFLRLAVPAAHASAGVACGVSGPGERILARSGSPAGDAQLTVELRADGARFARIELYCDPNSRPLLDREADLIRVAAERVSEAMGSEPEPVPQAATAPMAAHSTD